MAGAPEEHGYWLLTVYRARKKRPIGIRMSVIQRRVAGLAQLVRVERRTEC